VKTAARYVRAAQEVGLARDGGLGQLTDELLGMVVAAVRPARPAGHGESWRLLEQRKDDIGKWVRDDLTLVRIGELLERSGTAAPYRTLARFAAAECGYCPGGPKVTVRVDDGEPGREVQVDFGYLGMIADGDRKRKLHALVFTAVFSRYCYVYLTFRQTTAAVIAGCEAAWAFYGGVFAVLVPDNLKPVVEVADRLEPAWNREWLEYAQARGIVTDPARVRSPQDKDRVAYCTSSGCCGSGWCLCWSAGSCGSAGLGPVGRVVGVDGLVEVFVLVVVSLGTDKSGLPPAFDRVRVHAKGLGGLGEGAQALAA
jgi:hypothetical protein